MHLYASLTQEKLPLENLIIRNAQEINEGKWNPRMEHVNRSLLETMDSIRVFHYANTSNKLHETGRISQWTFLHYPYTLTIELRGRTDSISPSTQISFCLFMKPTRLSTCGLKFPRYGVNVHLPLVQTLLRLPSFLYFHYQVNGNNIKWPRHSIKSVLFSSPSSCNIISSWSSYDIEIRPFILQHSKAI